MRLEEKLVCLRKERHMTQLELAEKLDVSRQAISKWEVGSTVPSTENLIRLAQLYSVPVDRLVNDALDLSAPPEGCIFAPRCGKACDACFRTRPGEVQMDGVHKVACHLYKGGERQ